MNPIYICGCDRSGTTMLGSIIGAHSKCVAIPETHFFIDALRHYEGQKPFDASKFLERVMRHWRFRLWDFPLTDSQQVFLSTFESPPALQAALVDLYVETESRGAASCWVDHTPSNVQYLSTLFSFYPKAKAIHLVRDGRAVASSVIPLDWGPVDVSGAASWWMQKIVHGLAAEITFPETILRIRYEDVLNNPKYELARIQQFLNLPLEDLSEKLPRFKVPEYTKAQHQLVGKFPDPSRASAWQYELPIRDVETFEYLTGELLSYLGYTLTHGLSASPPPKETAATAIKNYFKQRSNKQQRKKRILIRQRDGK